MFGLKEDTCFNQGRRGLHCLGSSESDVEQSVHLTPCSLSTKWALIASAGSMPSLRREARRVNPRESLHSALPLVESSWPARGQA